MLSPDKSRFLAKIKQIALRNNDYEMIETIEKIKNDTEITRSILNYESSNR